MGPTNPLVDELLADYYAATMAYGYWKTGRHEVPSVFDVFFRKTPFDSQFAVFAGLDEVLRLVEGYHFKEASLAYIRKNLPHADPMFFDWLRDVDCSGVRIRALPEGTLAFPRVPTVIVEGPLAVAQLLEAALLNLTNYASLMTTNAVRFKLAAGSEKSLLEFGVRRAQGPDGAISGAKFAYMGGFDATSNMKAGELFDIPLRGTMAHAFVTSFSDLSDITDRTIAAANGQRTDFVDLVSCCKRELGLRDTNEGELAAFIAYAQAFPKSFLALIDTYETLQSGLPNFLAVALALHRLGYRPLGIRLDSGDLAYLSKEVRKALRAVSEVLDVEFANLAIVASNDLEVRTLYALRDQGHEIDVFGVGTHAISCLEQPAFGGVYKLVAIDGQPRIKLSDDPDKVTIPGAKQAYRLIGEAGHPLLDLMAQADEPAPQPGQRILCRHPFNETKRVHVTPNRVVPLYQTVWDGRAAKLSPSLDEIRRYISEQVNNFRPDHLRWLNPTPYKVSVSDGLYTYMHRIWLHEAPISELR